MKLRVKSLLGTLAILGGVALTGPAIAQTQASQQDLSNPDSAFAALAQQGKWQAVVKRTESGHLIGDPEAGSAMIEFISYTCPHCATFTQEGERGLELVLISPGKMSLEVRPVIRNPLDLAASLLAACGDATGFKDRHRMLMNTQDEWFENAKNAPRSQIEIWFRGDSSARLNMATALGLVDMLAKAGQSRSAINACLTDDAAAQKLIENSDADRVEFAIPGTPSFALDGKLIKDAHDWKALYPILSAYFADAAPAPGTLPPRN